MKIFLCDGSLYKTTRQLRRYWESTPDIELKCDTYWNPLKAEWADAIWVEWTEGSIQRASERKGFYPDVVSDHQNYPDREYAWPNAKVINRMIDIETYYGHFRSVQWQNVDYLTYIGQHIFEMVNKEMQFAERFPKLKTLHIPLSVDLDEWTYRKHEPGFNLAWVNHNWTGKGLPLMIQALHKLIQVTNDNRWKLNIVCDWSNEHWYPPYIRHLIAELNLQNNVQFFGKQDNLNEFLDEMNYMVSSSYKEAFSLILAESAAKGLKVLTHNWIGAKNIWPTDCVWTTIDEFVEKILQPYNSEYYRSLAEKYDKKFEIEAASKIMNYAD